ncbi:MAG: hypothetical protein K6A82_04150 [Prevotella sp.]|nr:hypothetical protein [Prevotella sp.]
MKRTITIPDADNAFLETLAQEKGWIISPISGECKPLPALDTPDKRKKAIETLRSVAGSLPNCNTDNRKKTKEEYLREKYL